MGSGGPAETPAHSVRDHALREMYVHAWAWHSAKTDWSRRILDFQYMDYDDQAAHHA